MKKYAFGVDVGGTTCKIGFFETDGRLIVWKHECLDAMQIQFIEHDFNAFF